MKAEIVKEVTGIKIDLTASEARAMYHTIYTLFDQIGVTRATDRLKRPDLVPFYHLYDMLMEGGFDQ